MNDKTIATPDDDAAHVLIVDDDTRIRELLTEYLGQNGFRVSNAGTAEEACRKIDGLEFDLLILDVMMPGESGVSMARRLREERHDVPILMLTARSETDERIEGLEAGADDYLPKPFDPRELLLRVRNIVRRGAPQAPMKIEQIVFGPFTFVIPKRELKKNGEAVHLTDREQEIMVRFAEKAGDTIPRHEMFAANPGIGERTIDVQINRLRRKIESDPANPRYLQTVRGIGYRLSVE
ncbi:response regulator [Oricola sp.]|uniref:response regulator n=1 Tax=Oricola sp. TaxID=1979950 RepID=UPI003BA96469